MSNPDNHDHDKVSRRGFLKMLVFLAVGGILSFLGFFASMKSSRAPPPIRDDDLPLEDPIHPLHPEPIDEPEPPGEGPVITSIGLTSERNTAFVDGWRFREGDTVFVDDIPYVTRLGNARSLWIEIPQGTQGGVKIAKVQRGGEAITSNSYQWSLVPRIYFALKGGNIARIGSTIKLRGEYFASNMSIRINDQDTISNMRYIDTSNVLFSMISPSSFREMRNGGKSITVKVILADGLMSNERQVLLDTFSMFVLGDSIQWGQGLEPGQKIHSKVADRILDAEGRDGTFIYKEVRAHSGAVIGNDTHVQINEPPSNEDTSRIWREGRFVFGEVPSSEPWILYQINNRFEVEPEAVDLILVDGGINDVNIRTILDYNLNDADLHWHIWQRCQIRMERLLRELTRRFSNPETKIIVTGYFPMLTNSSNSVRFADSARGLLDKMGGTLSGDAILTFEWVPALAGLVRSFHVYREIRNGGPIWRRLLSNSATWARLSTEKIQGVINDTNTRLGGITHIFFAVPEWGDDNGIFAPSNLLFDISTVVSIHAMGQCKR